MGHRDRAIAEQKSNPRAVELRRKRHVETLRKRCPKSKDGYEKALEVIERNFPKGDYPRVADIAGGHGRMAKLLARAGYKVTLIDPEAGLDYYGKKVSLDKKIKVLKRKFLVKDAERFDLLVALSPCEASQKAVRAAKRKPLVFAPCICRRVWPGRRDPAIEAAAFFRKMKVPFKKKDGLFLSTQKE